MGRIGKQAVNIKDVEVEFKDRILKIKGSKGELSIKISKRLNVDIDKDKQNIRVSLKFNDKYTQGLHGTIRSQIFNMVKGVTDGFEKKLQFSGVGFRASASENKLTLNLGFSHPVEITIHKGINFKVEKNIITVSGIDKKLVGEIAAKVRKVYPPEPYKGKGIAYIDEIIKRKPGKAVAKTEGIE